MSFGNVPIIMEGQELANKIKARLKKEIVELQADGITPGLGTILVGDDSASSIYITMKHRVCEEIGIRSFHSHLPSTTSQEKLHEAINGMNQDCEVDGILVQMPLPDGLNDFEALLSIYSEKDADGLNPINLGRLVTGNPGPLPCTPNGILALLNYYRVPIEGKNVVIVGRGLTIGRPLALLMSMKRHDCNAAVTVLHSGVPDLASYLQKGDIIIAAAGSPGLIKKEMVKPGAAVVAAGITRKGRTLLSDIEEEVKEVAGWITPRVGGVGPMTVAMLMDNTVQSAKKRKIQVKIH